MILKQLFKRCSIFTTGALLIATAVPAAALDADALIKRVSKGGAHLQAMQQEYEKVRKDNNFKDYANSLKKSISAEQKRCKQLEQDIRKLANQVQNTENINCRDKEGRTLIMLVAALGVDATTEMVMAENPDLSIVDHYNKLALDYEFLNGGRVIADMLKKQWAAAMHAADSEAMQELISYGADPNWGNFVETAHPGPGNFGEDESNMSRDLSSLEIAILTTNGDLLTKLLMCGANPNRKTAMGVSLIELALRANAPQIVLPLLSEIKDVDIILSDGRSLLQRLILNKDTEALCTLLTKLSAEDRLETADGTSYFCMVMRYAPAECGLAVAEQNQNLLNLEDREGNLPLHEAARRGQATLYRKMIEWGAEPNRKNARGETVLMHAAMSASADTLAEVIKSISAETLNATDAAGRTAHYYAKLAQDKAAAQALKAAGLHPKNKD